MEEMVRAEEIHREEDARGGGGGGADHDDDKEATEELVRTREIHREENTQGGAGRSAPARGAPQLSPLTRSPRPRPGRPRTLPHRRELRHRPCPCRAWARNRCSSSAARGPSANSSPPPAGLEGPPRPPPPAGPGRATVAAANAVCSSSAPGPLQRPPERAARAPSQPLIPGWAPPRGAPAPPPPWSRTRGAHVGALPRDAPPSPPPPPPPPPSHKCFRPVRQRPSQQRTRLEAAPLPPLPPGGNVWDQGRGRPRHTHRCRTVAARRAQPLRCGQPTLPLY